MKRIAIIGAGPIGIEAAVLASRKGFDVKVYERGEVGEHVLGWGHVRLFSPWSLNRSEWGKQILDGLKVDEDAFPTGKEFVDTYVKPLAATLPDGTILENTDVVSVSRAHGFKGDMIGDPKRGGAPFRLHVSDINDVERYEFADIVIDASGVFDFPNAIGKSGLPALNDWKHEDRIDRYIPDFETEKEFFAGKRILVLGGGYSAITSLKGLIDLKRTEPSTTLHWAVLGETPYTLIDDDPLPERNALGRLGNEIAAGKNDAVVPHVNATVYSIQDSEDGGVKVTLETPDGNEEIVVDHIVANVGYRPNMEVTRELQVHHCWASEGPMKLAASLLAQSGNADCLQQSSAGIDTLKNPEPNFFVIGAKSYGRNSSFLLRVGCEQIEEIINHLA